MTEKKIDLSACNRCGLCAKVCPLAIIHMRGEPPYPDIPTQRDVFCVSCGHCEAICPVGAIELLSPLLSRTPIGAKQEAVNSEKLFSYFAGRRSIRNFKSESVPRSTLEKLMDIVRYAPSAVNRQPVKWVVISDVKKIEAVARTVVEWSQKMVREGAQIAQRLNLAFLASLWKSGKDPICRNAPHLIIAYCQKDDASGGNDAIIALAHLELAAPSLGLGACWAGYVNIALTQLPDLRADLSIPEDCLSHGAMLTGYPAYSYARIPKRNKAAIAWI